MGKLKKNARALNMAFCLAVIFLLAAAASYALPGQPVQEKNKKGFNDNQRLNAKNKLGMPGNGNNAKGVPNFAEICLNIMEKNGVSNPRRVCDEIMSKKADCKLIAEKNGVKNAERLCKAINSRNAKNGFNEKNPGPKNNNARPMNNNARPMNNNAGNQMPEKKGKDFMQQKGKNMPGNNAPDQYKQGDVKKQHFEKCLGFLKSRNIGAAEEICKEAVNREKDCAAFLRNKGVKDPEKLCSEFGKAVARRMASRELLQGKLGDNVPEWKLNRIESMLNNKELNKKAKDFIQKIPKDKINVFMSLPKARQKEIVEKQALEMLNRFKVKKVSPDMRFKKRVLPKDFVKKAENQYKFAAEEFKKARQFSQKNRQAWMNAREKIRKECGGNNESEQCQALKEDMLKNAKDYLLNQAELVIAHLEKIKSKIEADENLDSATAESLMNGITQAISKTEELKSKIEQAETKEELKEYALDLKRFWEREKYRAANRALHMLGAKLNVVVEKSQALEDKLDCIVTQLEDEGVDTADFESLIDSYSSAIVEAQDMEDEIKGLIEEARDIRNGTNLTETEIEQLKELNAEIREKTKGLNAKLKEAHGYVKEFFKGLKGYSLDLSSCKEDNVVVEEVEGGAEASAETNATEITNTTSTNETEA